MNTLVREVFAVTSDTPIDQLEALVKRLETETVVWGQGEEEAYEWAVEDMTLMQEKLERGEEVDVDEFERLYWLTDALGDVRYHYFRAHEEEIVADYQPSPFEIAYARLVFGDTDPGTLM